MSRSNAAVFCEFVAVWIQIGTESLRSYPLRQQPLHRYRLQLRYQRQRTLGTRRLAEPLEQRAEFG